ncbi:hypothetical protein FKM82_008631 [Ascaphus truei]
MLENKRRRDSISHYLSDIVQMLFLFNVPPPPSVARFPSLEYTICERQFRRQFLFMLGLSQGLYIYMHYIFSIFSFCTFHLISPNVFIVLSPVTDFKLYSSLLL